MKKLPKKVLIYGQYWQVKIEAITEDLAGECDYTNQIIYINSKIPKKDYHETLIHEFIHATLYRCGMYQALSKRENEAISEALTVAFLENVSIKWG